MAKRYFFNRIRAILVLFLFGFMLIALGIGYTLRGINADVAVNLLVMAIGVLLIALAIYLVKKHF
jgi:uncharacterized membrane protein AbrB (regulator of aidB expression)